MNNKFRGWFVAIIGFLFLVSISLGSVKAGNIQKDFSIPGQETQALSNESIDAAGTTRRVSVTLVGIQGNDNSQFPSISADGRYVAFSSRASNLVSGDTNGVDDIFVVDTQTGILERVSIASDGIQSNNRSETPAISSDGRFVAFTSQANNLISSDTNQWADIFLHDRQTGQTKRLSEASDGTQADGDSNSPTISADGNFVAFASMANNLSSDDNLFDTDIFIHNTGTGETELISVASDGTQANSFSYLPSISADGTKVAFGSYASNLVPDDSGWPDIFVHNRGNGETTRVSVASDGTQSNHESYRLAISADGRYVAFESAASNLVAEDTNHSRDVFLHDSQTSTTILISKDSAGTLGNDWSASPSLSEDGRYITFSSRADNLATGDTNQAWDAFMHDRITGQTHRVSVASDGTQGIGESGSPWDPNPISGNGQYIAFESNASNLVICGVADTNGYRDILLRDLAGDLSSISGTVNSTDSASMSNVTISSGKGHTIQTDNNGNYVFSDMCPGSYSLSAELWGYAFSPTARHISVPPNATTQDFTGQLLTYSFLPAISQTFCGIAFYDDFNAPNSEWPIYEDNDMLFDFVNGEYKIVAKNPDWWVAASPDYQAENFSVGVQVRNPGGKAGTYGIIFNLAEDWSHFYSLEIDTAGYFGIWRYSYAKGWKLLLVNSSPFINLGTAANNIKVRREGELIEVYANDHLLASISDNSFVGQHYLGLIVSSFDQGYLDVRFDNFSITPTECGGTSVLSAQELSSTRPFAPRFISHEANKNLR
jgi:hypothetical protein